MTARLAALADAASILLFAALGRASHARAPRSAAPWRWRHLPDRGRVGWAAARGWRAPTSLATGAAAWAGALVVGMLLRNLAWDRGTAPSFVIVTAIVLGVRCSARLAGSSTLRLRVATEPG